jgi:hypothetical protein
MQMGKIAALLLALTSLSACASSTEWDNNYSVTADGTDLLPLND